MPPPKKGVTYTLTRTLFSTASPGAFQVNPTIAAGDFRLSKDNGTLANLTNLPTVTPAGSVLVRFVFTAAEMTADALDMVGIDQAGNEWGPIHVSFDTTTQTVDDIPTAVQNADALLRRDWTLIAGGEPPAYSAWQALRQLRNVWNIVTGVLHVKREDGVTDGWSRPVTSTPVADAITGVQ
jgi:hypothetical protein